MKKIKIGITGGIGSGKSTIAELYKEKGFTVLSADDIAKEIMVSDQDVISKIKSEFGEEAYNGNELNKQFLAEKVFNDEQEIMKINMIVHPPTINKMIKLMNEALKKSKIVFAESALIFEAQFEEIFDHIMLVTASDEHKIERVTTKSNLSADDVSRRIANQMPDDEKKKGSDFVLENDSSIDDLKSKAEFFLTLIKNM